jgi:hypothetical protein
LFHQTRTFCSPKLSYVVVSSHQQMQLSKHFPENIHWKHGKFSFSAPIFWKTVGWILQNDLRQQNKVTTAAYEANCISNDAYLDNFNFNRR